MTTTTADSPARDIVFIDSRVQDTATLLQGLQPGTEVVFLQAGQDGLAQMAAALGERGDVGTVQVIAHGSAGQLWLGSSFLDNAALQRPEVQAQLAALGLGLTADGDLLIYACNTAQGSEGAQFVSTLAALTGADVAASDDRTGAGGDWELELSTGSIGADAALSAQGVAQYQHSLATLTVTTGADTGSDASFGANQAADLADGAGLSLREALHWAQSGDTVTFSADMTISLSTKAGGDSLLILNKNLTIDGDWDNDGTADVTLDGQHKGQVLNISSGTTVTLDGLTITNGLLSGNGGNGGTPNGGAGASALGAGIYNAGTLTITHSSLTGNVATGGGGAGGGGASGRSGFGGGGGSGFAGTGGGNGGVGHSSSGANGGSGSGGGGDSATGSTGGDFYSYSDGQFIRVGGNGGTSTGGGTGGLSAYSYSIGGNGASVTGAGGGGGGAGYYGGGSGGVGGMAAGGIYNASGATLNIADTTFSSNKGAGGGGGGQGTYGDTVGAGGLGTGAIYNLGTLNYNAASTTFTSNEGVGGNASYGGAAAAGSQNLGGTAASSTTWSAAPAPTVTLSVSSASVAEAAGTATLTATLSAAAAADTVVTIGRQSGSTATLNSDFTLSSTTITITAGQTTGTATLTAVQDALDEADETAIIEITGVSGGGGATESGVQQQTVTITDDDAPPSLSINDVSVVEGNSGTSNMTFTVTLSSASGLPVSVNYATANGTATAADSDYIASSGMLTFAAGETSKTFTVAVAGDTTAEPSETFMVALSNPVNATLATASATGTIQNDDSDVTPPSISSINRAGTAITNATSVDYTVTFSESVTGVNTSDFTLTGTGAAGTVAAVTGSGSTYTVTVNGISGDGTLRLDLKNSGTGITDVAGNAITSGFSSGETYIIDTAPAAPSAPDLESASDTGVSSSDNITSDTTPTFRGTAEAGATVTLYDTDGTTVLGTAIATGGNWAITSTTLAEGTHSIKVTATDIAGNVSAASAGLPVTIDTTAPTLGINSNVSTLRIGETADITFAFSEDPGATFTLGDVTVSGGTLGPLSGTGLTRTATFTPAAATNGGTASITVAAGAYTDTAGNSGGAGATPTLTFDTLAPAAPSAPDLAAASDTGVSSSDDITSNTTPTFTGTAVAGSTVRLYDTNGYTLLGTATADGSGNWSITSSALLPGAHTLTAKATDAAGNVSSASAGLTVHIAAPAIDSATYNASTGVLVVSGAGFSASFGASNDIVANKFSLQGEGGMSYTLTTTSNVEITSATSFTLTLSAADRMGANLILNKNGTSSTGAATYNLIAAEDWAAGADAAVVVADLTGNGITVSNVVAPTVTSATYNVATGVLVVTGADFLTLAGANNDIVANRILLQGQGAASYTLTDTSNVDITSNTSFTVTMSATDRAALALLMNKDGTSATDSTIYNLGMLEDWNSGANAPVVIADLSGNGITVSGANAAPVATTSGGSTAFVEGANVVSTPVAVDSGITLSDADNTTLASATVAITGNFQSGEDLLALTSNPASMGNITASYDSATGVLTLSSAGASATLAQWQAALRAVTYTNSSETPNTASRTLSFAVNDGTSSSSAATRVVTVAAVNDAPVAVADSLTVAEGGTATTLVGGATSVLANDTDGEASTLVSVLVTGPAHGSLTLNANGTFSYVHNGSDTTTDSFSYKPNDGTADGNTVSVAITVTPVNDAPTITGLPGSAQAVTAGAAAALADFAVADADGAAASLTVTLTATNGTINGLTDADTNQAGIQLSGTAAAINAAIASATFTAGAAGAASIGVSVSDGIAPAVTGTYHLSAAAAVNNAPTFAPAAPGTGKLVTDFGSGASDVGHSVTVQADGKIVVAGASDSGSSYNFGVVRYNTDGSLDTGFNGTGKLVTDFGSGTTDVGYSVTAQADGKIVVAGASYSGSSYNFAVVRYNTDGSLDTGFNGTGKLVTDFGSATYDVGFSVTVQTDGKIVVAGISHSGSSYNFAVVRYNTDGSLDTGFNGTGKLVTDFGSATYDEGRSVTVQADGKIVVTGYSHSGSSYNFAVARYNTDGSLDTGFNSTGKLVTDFGSGADDLGYSVTVQADGKIVVAGYSNSGGSNDFAVVRYNTDGSLDTGFGSSGKLVTDIGSGTNDVGHSVTVQADGKIVVAGYSNSGGSNNFAVARYNTDGSLDTSFGSGGKLVTDIGSGTTDVGHSVTVQADGKIVVTGYSNSGGGSNNFAVVRYNTDGSLDTGFNPGPAVNTLGAAVAYTENASAIALDTSVAVFDADLAALNGGAGNYSGASVTLARAGGSAAEDVFSARGNLAFTAGSAVLSGTTVGTVGNTGGTLTISFNANATQALVNEVLSSIGYANTSDAPPASVQVDWSFSDGNTGSQGSGGALTAAGSTTVNITAVNDAPTITGLPGSAQAVTAGAAAALADFAVTDADGAAASLTVTLTATNGTINGLTDADTNQAGIQLSGTAAAINAAIASATFTAGAAGAASIGVSVSDGIAPAVTGTYHLSAAAAAAVNNAPTVANAVPDQTASEGSAFNFKFAANTFADVDVGDTLSYTAQLAGGGALPAWLTFDPGTRTFSGTPANVGTVSIEVVADDGHGGTVNDRFELVIGAAPVDPGPDPVPPVTPPVLPPTPGIPDNDGVPTTVEDQAPGIPGPGGVIVAGDGNGDGIKDSQQDEVASITFLLSPTVQTNPGNAAPTFTTLVTSSQDGKVGSGNDNSRILSLQQLDAPQDVPGGMQTPLGLVSFTVALAASKTGENFSLYLDPALGINGYWKQDASGTWVNLASEPYGGKMVMEGGRLRLDFRIEDGGQFDADGKADGIITDPGAPAYLPLSIVGHAPELFDRGFWF